MNTNDFIILVVMNFPVISCNLSWNNTAFETLFDVFAAKISLAIAYQTAMNKSFFELFLYL